MPVEKQLEALSWPKCMTPKYDGLRVIMHPSLGVVTSSLKPFPNRHVRKKLEPFLSLGFDAEVYCGSHEKDYDFNLTSGQLRRFNGEPDFTVKVFDIVTFPDLQFQTRFRTMLRYFQSSTVKDCKFISLAPMRIAKSVQDVLDFEAICLTAGYEGVMLRCPQSKYKYGKSTLKEQYLIKVKRFVDQDAIIIGYEQMFSNGNAATIDERGLTKRSTHQDNMIPMDTLGKLIVRGLEGDFKDKEFSIGTGMTMAQRKDFWKNQAHYLGKKVVFKFQNHGIKDSPRIPVLKGVRED